MFHYLFIYLFSKCVLHISINDLSYFFLFLLFIFEILIIFKAEYFLFTFNNNKINSKGFFHFYFTYLNKCSIFFFFCFYFETLIIFKGEYF